MRVLVVSHTGLRSGAEIVLERIVGAATARGWEVTALTPPGPTFDGLIAAGAGVHAVPNLTLSPGPRARAGLGLLRRNVSASPVLRRAAHQADVVVVNGLLGLPSMVAARPRAPVVWLVHDVIERFDHKAVARLAAGTVHCAAAVSEVAAVPVRASGIPVEVIEAGTPFPVRPRSPEPTGPPVVGCAAALTPWKGHHVLLEAFATVAARRESTLELLGSPYPRDVSYVETLRARAEAADLRGRVRFLGYQSDPSAIVRRWTVAVSASVAPEGAGLATLEAMSLGVPVVGTDLGVTRHIVGPAGLLVQPGDSGALADAILGLTEDPDRWERCHFAGPQRVEERYQLDRQLAQTLDLLEKVTRAAPPSRAAHRRSLRAATAPGRGPRT